MNEDKDQTAREPANDVGDAAVTEFPDEGAATVAPEERVEALEAELAETKDRLLRALAETENVRRRAQREREDTLKYAISNFSRDLLSPVDNLRRALDSVPEAEITDQRTKSLLDGVAATERELLATFERYGLKRIDPKGERFDHNFHQAIFEAQRPGAAPGTIIEVLQPGYVLHDRLLRPAMVGVAKAGSPPAEKSASDEES
jgi:molecular chaperone GrpE